MKYPKWFPYPSSWLNAVLVMGLAGLTSWIVKAIFFTGLTLAVMRDSYGTAILTCSFVLLSPIFVVALVHHLLHLCLSRFFPSLQAPEIGQVTGAFPSLFSWWEGLLSWTVIAIATVVTFMIGTFTASAFFIDPLNVNYQDFSQEKWERFSCFLGFVWLAISAYLYQCFYLVEERLIAVGKKSVEERSTRWNLGH